jgi:hypothetical protein
MAMGQAAGTLAAMGVAAGEVRKVDPAVLRSRLANDGAILTIK